MSLYRSSDDKVIAGVCGGLAHQLGFKSTGFRWVVFIVSFFCVAWTLPIVAYIAAWILLPEQPTKANPPKSLPMAPS